MLNIFKISSKLNLEKILFLILIIISLIPVWLNKYFLTLDSPMHLNNAKMLLDHIRGQSEFYAQLYNTNYALYPYWFSHITLAFLLWLFPTFIAEKIFLSIYIILFPVALRVLLKIINKEATFLSFLGFLFVYHFSFHWGLFNYCYSIIFYFLTVRYWLKYYQSGIIEQWQVANCQSLATNSQRATISDQQLLHPGNNRTIEQLNSGFSIKNLLILTLLFLLLYFTHIVSFFFAILTIFILIVVHSQPLKLVSSNSLRQLAKGLKKPLSFRGVGVNFITLFLAVLPPFLLTLNFMSEEGATTINIFHSTKISIIFQNFLKLSTLTFFTEKEISIAIAISVLIGIIFIYTLVQKVRKREFSRYEGLFLVFIIVLLIHIFGPTQIGQAAGITFRTQIYPYLILILWLATISFHKIAKWTIICSAFIIATTSIIIRIPSYIKTNKLVNEYVSAEPYIKDQSLVLPLYYAHYGKTADGKQISELYNNLFTHAVDYIGTKKQLIILNSISGIVKSFPYQFKQEINPYLYLQTNEGFDFNPPSADILNYNKRIGRYVDYVLLCGLDAVYINHPYTQNILAQLVQGYELVYSSENNIVQLYRCVIAERHIQQSLDLVKTQPTAENYLNLSAVYYNEKQYENCINACKEAIKLEPDFAIAYNNICASYNQLNRPEEAFEACKKCLEIDPQYSLARGNLSWALKLILSKMLKKDNPSAEDYINLSAKYYNEGKYQECIWASEEALKIKPNFALGYNNICASYNQLNKPQEALQMCKKCIEFEPTSAIGRANLSWTLKLILSKMLNKEVLTAVDYVNLSAKYYNERKYQECIWACEEAIKIDPNLALAYNNICAAYNNLGKWEEAIKACEKSLSLEPDNELAKNNLKWAIQGLQQLGK